MSRQVFFLVVHESYEEAISAKDLLNGLLLWKEKVINWIYKNKEWNSKNEQSRYKVKLFTKGYTQRKGIDFHKIISKVVKP